MRYRENCKVANYIAIITNRNNKKDTKKTTALHITVYKKWFCKFNFTEKKFKKKKGIDLQNKEMEAS